MCPWPLRKIVMHGVTHDLAAPLPRERKTHVHAETCPARSWLRDLRRPRGGLSPDAHQVTDGRPCFPGHRNNTDARSPGSPWCWQATHPLQPAARPAVLGLSWLGAASPISASAATRPPSLCVSHEDAAIKGSLPGQPRFN